MDISFVQVLLAKIWEFLPRFLGAIGIFILGWVLARVLSNLLKIILQKSRIDRLSDKLASIDIVSRSGVSIVPSILISKLVYYLILIFALLVASDTLKLPTLSALLQEIINYLPKLLVALTMLAIGTVFADFLRRAINTAGKSLGIPSIRIISTVIFYFLFINIAISALAQAGINTDFLQSNLTMIIGGVVVAFGVGYGLASKDVLSNFLAAHYHHKSIRPGDTIEIGEVKGIVNALDKTSIHLMHDGKITIIPFKKLNNENVTIYPGNQS